MLLDKHCIGNKGMILIKGRDVIIIMRKKKKKICRPGLVWIQCSNVWSSHDIETYLKLITYPQHVPSNILEHIDLNFALISHPKLGHFQLSRPLQFSSSFLFIALSYNYNPINIGLSIPLLHLLAIQEKKKCTCLLTPSRSDYVILMY